MKNNKMYKNAFRDEKRENNNINKKAVKKHRFTDADEYDDWRMEDYRGKIEFSRVKK
jgi:hypothetical protein